MRKKSENKSVNKLSAKKKFRLAMADMPAPVHKALTLLRIRQLSRHFMTEEERRICDISSQKKTETVEKYKKKCPVSAKKFEKAFNKMLEYNSLANSFADLDEKKKDMEYCWYAYGVTPDQYMYFRFFEDNKDPALREKFVSEQKRVCLRLSVNDFSDPLLSDKADTYKYFRKYYKRDAVLIDADTQFSDFERFADANSEFVQKFVSSSRGMAVKLIKTADIDKKQYFETCKASGRYLLEERIQQSDELRAFGESLHNIRVSTFRTHKGIIPAYGFFTMGKKDNFVVNATNGCVFASIDCKTGILDSEGGDKYGNRYLVHPDSGIAIKGYQLPDWDDAVKLCVEVASLLKNYGFVSFDLAHTTKGWDIIEINPSGQLLHQAGTLKGCRDELLGIIEDMDRITEIRI